MDPFPDPLQEPAPAPVRRHCSRHEYPAGWADRSFACSGLTIPLYHDLPEKYLTSHRFLQIHPYFSPISAIQADLCHVSKQAKKIDRHRRQHRNIRRTALGTAEGCRRLPKLSQILLTRFSVFLVFCPQYVPTFEIRNVRSTWSASFSYCSGLRVLVILFRMVFMPQNYDSTKFMLFRNLPYFWLLMSFLLQFKRNFCIV